MPESKKFLDVIYVGEDQRFFNLLKQNITDIVNDTDKEIYFEQSRVPDGQYPTTFKSFWLKSPMAIILDFASYAENGDERYDYLIGLARLLRQNEQTRSIITISVYDYLQKTEVVEQVLMAGIRFNYIKSSENDLIANELLHILNIPGFQAHELAIAEKEMTISISQDLRIGYASSNYLRVETNIPLTVGVELQLSKNPFQGVQNLPLVVEVHKPNDGACYYPYKFPYHLYYKKLGDVEFKSVELTEMNEVTKPKWARVLVVDPDLEFIDNSLAPFDQIEFTLNIQSDVISALEEITRFKPHIISVQNLDESQIKKLKTAAKDSLFLSFKDRSNAPLTSTDSLTFNFIEKALVKYDSAKKPEFGEELFFDSRHKFTVAHLEREIKVMGFNESLVYFTSDDQLPLYCVFRMRYPFDGLMTTVPNYSKNEKFSKCYVGLLNYNTESMIQRTRREFNSIFAKDVVMKRNEEIDEFKKLNDKFSKKDD